MAIEQWPSRWKKIRELGAGGQGTTYEVESVTDGLRGVLKLLKKDDDSKARARMAIEAINLQTLEKDHVRVPRLLDHNTKEHANPDLQLYIVMEFIAGQTLDKIVASNGRLSLQQSLALALNLCGTIESLHKADVLHRDLKPANLIVRDHDTADVVVLDLGLSFERTAQESLTATNETMKNELFSLPEATIPGGDRRDPRSDMTNIAGVFFYCLTGKLPGLLRDASDQPPHRRAGQVIREIVDDKSVSTQVDLAFDRAFAVDIASRFQTLPELAERLRFLLSPMSDGSKSPVELDRVLGLRLRQRDREFQLQEMRDFAGLLWPKITAQISNLTGKTTTFLISLGRYAQEPQLPTGIEFIAAWDRTIVVTVERHTNARMCPICVGANGMQCAILYAIGQPQKQAGPLRRAPLEPGLVWKPFAWFNPKNPPSNGQIERWINDVVSEAIETLDREI